MSSVPAQIAGLGSSAIKLRVSPGFDPLKAQVGPDEYFVLSRIDGTQSIRDLLLSTGLPIDRGIAIVTKLRSLGALLLPGETTAQPQPVSVPAAPTQGRAGSEPPARAQPSVSRTRTPHMPIAARRPPAPPAVPPAPEGLDGPTVRRAPTGDIQLVLPSPTRDERAALSEPGDLAADERLRILALARLVRDRDPWALLGVPSGADAKVLKRAYFKLSKEVHPDRYYGKQLGSFADLLSEVFEAISRAYARLTSPEKEKRSGVFQHNLATVEQPQTPAEYASELFERACGLEVGGDALGAMKLFAAAVRIDPQTRYLRRAATCALAAEQPKTAVEYAKKAQAQAPSDPSSARLLAGAFKAVGRLADAEEVLVMAMALKNENDVLTGELRNDLAEVRRLISAGG